MPVPNWTNATSPPVPCQQGDVWYDTVNNQLNIHNGTGFVPISSASIPSAMNGSLPGSAAGLLLVPVVAGSYGGSVAIPPNTIGLAYDASANRMWMVGSGGAHKSAAFA